MKNLNLIFKNKSTVLSLLTSYLAFPNIHLHIGPLILICFIPLWHYTGNLSSYWARLKHCWLFFQLFFLALFWMNPFAYFERYENWDMVLIYVVFFTLFPCLFGILFALCRNDRFVQTLWGFPLIWTAFEMALTQLSAGFPLSLAIALYNWPIFIQLSAHLPIYALSGLIMFCSLLLHGFLLRRQRRYLVALASILAGVTLHGWLTLQTPTVTAKPTQNKHAWIFIQPNIPWRQAYYAYEGNFLYKQILRDLERQSSRAIRSLPPHITHGTLIFPELTLSDVNSSTPLLQERLLSISQGRFNILIGARHNDINSILAITPTGNIHSVYHKQQTIPIFEHNESISITTPSPLSFPNDTTRWGLGICYELLFPSLIRSLAQQDASIIGAIAFNTWLGNTNWPLLHTAYLPFRSIETGKPGVFLNNNGPSIVTTLQGQIIQRLPLGQGGVLVIK